MPKEKKAKVQEVQTRLSTERKTTLKASPKEIVSIELGNVQIEAPIKLSKLIHKQAPPKSSEGNRRSRQYRRVPFDSLDFVKSYYKAYH